MTYVCGTCNRPFSEEAQARLSESIEETLRSWPLDKYPLVAFTGPTQIADARAAGFNTVGDLLAAGKDDVIKRVRGFGPKTAEWVFDEEIGVLRSWIVSETFGLFQGVMRRRVDET